MQVLSSKNDLNYVQVKVIQFIFKLLDLFISQWNEDLLLQEGFPVDLLPPVVAAGTDVGVLPMPWFDIPKGIRERQTPTI